MWFLLSAKERVTPLSHKWVLMAGPPQDARENAPTYVATPTPYA